MTTYYLFADTEGTGLDLERDEIIEIALILTRAQTLEPVERYYSLVQPTPDGLLRLVQTPAVIKMHTKNGLLLELIEQDAAARRDIAAVDSEVFDWLELNTEVDFNGGDIVHLAGSGVSEFDRPLIKRLMPNLDSLLHYRSIDIGNLRRVWIEWMGYDATEGTADLPHRALGDVEQFLRDARGFRERFKVINDALAVKD